MMKKYLSLITPLLNYSITSMRSARAFTLAEVMVTVAIITILATITTFSWQQVSRRAKVTRIVGDLKKIEAGWQLWRADTHQPFPLENSAGFVSVAGNALYCSDEILHSSTSIYNLPTDPDNPPGYQGPYLTQVLNDPLDQNREYLYDNDNDPYNPATGANVFGGANVTLQFCDTAQVTGYWALRNMIDEAIDGTHGDQDAVNGLRRGKFRAIQDATGADFLYLMEPNP